MKSTVALLICFTAFGAVVTDNNERHVRKFAVWELLQDSYMMEFVQLCTSEVETIIKEHDKIPEEVELEIEMGSILPSIMANLTCQWENSWKGSTSYFRLNKKRQQGHLKAIVNIDTILLNVYYVQRTTFVTANHKSAFFLPYLEGTILGLAGVFLIYYLYAKIEGRRRRAAIAIAGSFYTSSQMNEILINKN